MDRVTAFILRLAVTAMIAAALSFALRAAQASLPDMPTGCPQAASHANAPHAHAGAHSIPSGTHESAELSQDAEGGHAKPSCCGSPCMIGLAPSAVIPRLLDPVRQMPAASALTVPSGVDPDRLIRPPRSVTA